MEEDVRDWYDARHRARGSDAWRPRAAYAPFLDALGPLRPGARLLDVGCGPGHLLALARERGVRVTGVDISSEALRLVPHTAGGPATGAVSVGLASGTALPFAGHAFDYVTCIGVLEHFPDVRAGAAELARVTTPGGRLCIVVPNCNYFAWKLRGRGGTEQQEIGELLLGLDAWRDIMARAGLRVLEVGQDRWPIRRTRLLASSNPLGIARRLARRAAWAVLPLRWTYQFVFSLERPTRSAHA